MDEREDYLRFLAEEGLTDEVVWEISTSVPVLAMPSDSFIVMGSAIHGLGLFATRQIHEGANIAPALLMGCKTVAGRYANHSGEPNAIFVQLDDHNVVLSAVQEINEGEEITVDYRSK